MTPQEELTERARAVDLHPNFAGPEGNFANMPWNFAAPEGNLAGRARDQLDKERSRCVLYEQRLRKAPAPPSGSRTVLAVVK